MFRAGLIAIMAMLLIAASPSPVPSTAPKNKGPEQGITQHNNSKKSDSATTEPAAMKKNHRETKPENKQSAKIPNENSSAGIFEPKWIEAIAAAITGIFTIVLAVATIGLLRAGNIVLKVTERAYIVISGFNRELTTRADTHPHRLKDLPPEVVAAEGLDVTRFAVQPIWQNNGSTPPKWLQINVDWASGDLSRLGTYRNEDQRFFIAPKSVETSEFIEMPGLNELIQGGNAGALSDPPMMLIWGKAEYEDVFGKPHWINWCYRVRPDRHDGRTLRVSFIQATDYNQSDETI